MSSLGSKVKTVDSKEVKKQPRKSQKTQVVKKNKESVSLKEGKENLNNKGVKLVSTKINFKELLTKNNITYFILFLLDVILVVYSARKNVVNYVVISEQEFFVSKTKYLLWGRNYINLFIIGFFYIYICLVNKFFLRRKNTKKFLVWLLAILVFLNGLLFFLFTKKVY